jgi:hypothetical protein
MNISRIGMAAQTITNKSNVNNHGQPQFSMAQQPSFGMIIEPVNPIVVHDCKFLTKIKRMFKIPSKRQILKSVENEFKDNNNRLTLHLDYVIDEDTNVYSPIARLTKKNLSKAANNIVNANVEPYTQV